MKERKTIAILSESYDMLRKEALSSFQLLLRALGHCYDIVEIQSDSELSHDMSFILIPTDTDKDAYATDCYFRSDNSDLFHYSVYKAGQLRIELLEWRGEDHLSVFMEGMDISFPASNESNCSGIAHLLIRLLNEAIPKDFTRISEIDYRYCYPEGELDLSVEPEYLEVYYDYTGNTILEKYGRNDGSYYFYFYDEDRIILEVICCLYQPSIVTLWEHYYELDDQRRITKKSSIANSIPFSGKKTLYILNRWKRNGQLVHRDYSDGSKEIISFRQDGKEKHVIYLSNPDSLSSKWKEEHFYKYSQSGFLLSEKCKSYYKPSKSESDTSTIEVSYTYYGEDGRLISGKYDKVPGTYLNDENGNWIKYLELSPDGKITSLIIRIIRYVKGVYFVDTDFNMIHKAKNKE